MNLTSQNTIKKITELSGVGLHTGRVVKLTLAPAPINTGIVFERTDIQLNNKILANYKNVSSAKLCTTIENDYGLSISTVEHLLCAIHGEGIDNLIIKVDGPEIPIMDGSAIKFVEAIRTSGIIKQEAKRKFIKVLKKVEVKHENKFICIEPSNNNLDIDFEIVYENSLIKTQREKIKVYTDNLNLIYKSRTFCLYEDVEKIQSLGLAKGGSLDNAIVVKGKKILNSEGLRHNNEFVMHKVLDCLGDLILSGNRIFGTVTCSQGGHQLTNELLRSFFSNSQNWELVSIKEPNKSYEKFIYPKRIAVSA